MNATWFLAKKLKKYWLFSLQNFWRQTQSKLLHMRCSPGRQTKYVGIYPHISKYRIYISCIYVSIYLWEEWGQKIWEIFTGGFLSLVTIFQTSLSRGKRWSSGGSQLETQIPRLRYSTCCSGREVWWDPDPKFEIHGELIVTVKEDYLGKDVVLRISDHLSEFDGTEWDVLRLEYRHDGVDQQCTAVK